MLNGGGGGSSSGGSSGGGGGGDVKYPANCAARISVETNSAAAAAAADGTLDASILDRLYEPKPNKKIMRVITVIGYIFTVSMVAILLSLYYLVRNLRLNAIYFPIFILSILLPPQFLWNPYIKFHEKTQKAKGILEGGGSTLTTGAPHPTPFSTSSLNTALPPKALFLQGPPPPMFAPSPPMNSARATSTVPPPTNKMEIAPELEEGEGTKKKVRYSMLQFPPDLQVCVAQSQTKAMIVL